MTSNINLPSEQDQNQVTGLMLHTGTAGTAKTIRAVADANGNLMINMAVGSSSVTVGTIPEITNLVSGTITRLQGGTLGILAGGSIVVTAGTVTTSLALNSGTIDILRAGTIDNIVKGTITRLEGGTMQLSGTPSVNVIGGSIVVTAGTTTISGTIPVTGTVTTAMGDLSGGTIDELSNVAKGTLSYLGTLGTIVGTITNVGTLNKVGTVDIITAGTLTSIQGGTIGNLASGSVVVTTGTIVNNGGSVGVYGMAAAAATAVGNPVLTGGTTSTGTVYAALIDTSGHQQIDALTIPNIPGGTLGVLSSLTAGTVAISLGTIAIGTVIVTSQLAGTMEKLGTVNYMGTIGTIVGTLAAVGTVAKIGTVDIVTAGTLDSIKNIVTGTLSAVTSVTNVAAGSVVVTAGTVAAHAITNLAAGTLTKLEGGTLNVVAAGSMVQTAGTVTTILAGTQQLLGTVNNLGTITTITAGSITMVGGTCTTQLAGTQQLLGTTNYLGTVGIVTAGTLTALSSGTITAGTVKINATPGGSANLSTHVLGTGGTVWGTLVAPVGAGTNVYVTGCSIVGRTGTADYAITNNAAGSTGAGVLARGFFPPSGGIAKEFNVPIMFGTNGTVAYLVLGPGTADFNVSYWVGP